MKKALNKLFIGGDWKVKLFTPNGERIIKPEDGYWYADPFLFAYNEEQYLFVEAFDKRKELGYLGYLSSKDNFQKLNILIKEKYHFSFPNVFTVNDHVYMIPESSEKNGIYLYSFDDFPNGLKMVKKLISGSFVDTALVSIIGNKGFFITYNSREKALYSLNIDFDDCSSKLEKIKDDPNKTFRPAGNAFSMENELVMPFQNNLFKYGESILLRMASISSNTVAIEDDYRELKPIDFGLGDEVKRMHTYNILDDRNFAVDYMVEKVILTKSFKMMKRKLRRKKHSKEFKDE